MTDGLNELKKILAPERVAFDVPMKQYTSFRIGGNADILCMPETGEELIQCLNLAKGLDLPVLVMGNGSNLLFSDEGFRGMVIKLQEGFDALTVEGDTLVVQAGCLMSRLAKQACEHSLTGLEFAGGIPGTVGGGLYMNAGAYGGELKDHVISCQTVAYDENQGEYYAKTYTAGQMGLGYRSSVFQSNGEIITEVTFRLPAGDREESLKKIEELNAKRRASQPLTLPSAGSAFKRPKEGYAAQMIDEAGLKGFSVGGAQVSEKHSGFIVNTGDATAQDVLDLMAAVIKKVEETHGVTLEPEIRTVEKTGLQVERR